MTERSEIIVALDAAPGLEGKAYGDFANQTDFPYTTLLMDISDVAILRGDGRALSTERLVQVDLWEARATEDGTLRRIVWRTLDGLWLPTARCHLRVRSATRVPDPNLQIAHRAFTCAFVSPVVRT